MDLDLWGPPESRFYIQPERQCDFYLGYGYDMIEDNALNEKYCGQVLRILITKADAEIEKLEQDLVRLQSELAWIENEEWSETCGNALREKINWLDVSIRNLRNKDKNDIEVHLLMHTQSAERLHEILQALLKTYFDKKDEQDVKDDIVLDLSLDAPKHANNIFGENKKLANCNSEIMTCKEIKKSSTALILNPSWKLQETKTNSPRTVKCVNTDVADCILHPLKLVADHPDEKKLLGNIGPKRTGKGKAAEHGLTPKDKRMTRTSSSKSADKGRQRVDLDKVQPANDDVSKPTGCLSANIGDHSHKEKKMYDLDSIILSEEVEERSSISTADVSLGSSLKPMARKTDLGEKPANTGKGLGLNANRHATGQSKELPNLWKSGLKVSGNKGFNEHYSRANGKTIIFSPSLNPEGKANCPRMDKLADATGEKSVDKNVRCPTDHNGRKQNSDSGLGAFEQAKSSIPDIEQKICNFAPKAAHRRTMKKSKVAVTGNAGSLKAEGKKKICQQIVKSEEACVTDTKNCDLTSLLKPQDQQKNNAAKLQPRKEGKYMPEEVQMAEDADEKRSNLKISPNPPKEKAKGNVKLSAPVLQEMGISTLVIVSSSSSISEGKKRQRSGAGPLNASLNQSLNVNMTGKVVQHCKFEVKEHGIAPDDNPNSVSEPLKRMKNANSLGTVETRNTKIQMDFSNLHRDTTGSASKDDLSINESCSVCDSSSESVATWLSSTEDLKGLSLNILRSIAKEQNITKYYKLSKQKLLELLSNQISDC